MKIKIILAVFSISLLLLTACNRETPVSGSVFVVTQGKDNIKLGLTEVKVIAAAEVKKYLETQKPQVETILAKIAEMKTQCKGYESKYGNSDFSAQQLNEACQDRLDNEWERSTGFYFAGLPSAVSKATTDADGKFSLKIQKKGKYLIAAQSERKISSTRTESYFWLLPFEADGSEKQITLSNNNTLESLSNGLPVIGL